MHGAACRIVTRFKSNTPLTRVRWAKFYDPGLPLLPDRIGRLPARQAQNRKNPMEAEVREVTVRTDTGKILRVLTNDLTSPAQEIADLYKRRWAIELLFRWLRPNLKLKQFMGTSESAIRIQVFAASIAFLLLRLAYDARAMTVRMVRFVRGVRYCLLERRSLEEIATSLAAPPRPTRKSPAAPPAQTREGAFFWERFPWGGCNRELTGQSWTRSGHRARQHLAPEGIGWSHAAVSSRTGPPAPLPMARSSRTMTEKGTRPHSSDCPGSRTIVSLHGIWLRELSAIIGTRFAFPGHPEQWLRLTG